MSLSRCEELEKYIKLQVDSLASESLKRDSTSVYNAKLKAKSLVEMQEEYKKLGCERKITQRNQDVVEGIIKDYTTYDELRIRAESKFERNKKIFWGAVILFTALGLIITFSGDDK